MMTTVSIDMVGATSDAATTTPVNAAAGSDVLASGDAVSLFQQKLSEQAASNAVLGETVRAALVSVGDTLAKIDAAEVATPAPSDSPAPAPSSTPTPATSSTPTLDFSNSPTVQLPPLPQQVEINATLGTELAEATTVVGEVLADVVSTPVLSSTPAPVLSGTPTPEFSNSPTVQLPPLPQQVEANATLGVELTAATTVVGEVLAEVVSTTEISNSPTPVLSSTPTPEFSNAPTVQLPPLPQQVEANATLGSELAAATTVVGETLTKIVPEEPSEVNVEVNAEALVAAGVMPQVTVPVANVEAAVPQVVASVDAVSATSAAAGVSGDVLLQAATAVADTLLVSPGLLRGQGEVIVQLRPDVLEGTEVKISVMGRQLEVMFQPQTVDMAVLIENCRTQLVQHLSAKITTFNVSVDVRKKRS